MRYTKLWIGLSVVVVFSFAVLGYFGREIYIQAPPLPSEVVTQNGGIVFTEQQIREGQNVWQSIGGQEVGTVWGHGAYVAPDWSADWLHREAMWILNYWAQQQGASSYDVLNDEQKAEFRVRLQNELRTNTYNPKTGIITVTSVQAQAIKAISGHYYALFGDDPAHTQLRKDYSIPDNAIPDPQRRATLSAFYFWASWACITDRPGSSITYTNNWPPDVLVGNTPTASIVIWSLVSFIFLLAGIGALSWYFAAQRQKESRDTHELPDRDPLLALNPTPSMQATLKYFWIVVVLILAQICFGIITAHYGVEGNEFYGIPLAKWLPYAVTRTWHLQLGIFWIATAWLATGLFVAPAVSGYEPKWQKLGVNLLFICLLIIVAGSMIGQWLSIQQKLGLNATFWFGDQGYEYVDLGRFWQIFLFVGLFLWLFLMGRALWPAFHKVSENKHLLGLFFISSAAIALFYGAGLMYNQHTNLSIAEYWRWWVVHLWVEGFFEVFSTVVIAFLFTRMGLLKTATATASVLFSTIIFLTGGIIGTFHHLYFSGTPTAILALGASFSALEVVPLVLIGFEAYTNLTYGSIKKWVNAYRWPINYFVAVGFWNLVGAGLFGFLINPPIALYYMQGLNTTPVHAHTALFGVYGMLGIGLMLFCLKGLAAHRVWKTGVIAFSFWATNIGLALMVLLSLLPVGLLQTWASITHGMWYARSATFLQSGLMENLRWMRIFGDTIFAVGLFSLAWFIFGLSAGWSLKKEQISEADMGLDPVD
jgi:nitric oxide reductase subunit B